MDEMRRQAWAGLASGAWRVLHAGAGRARLAAGLMPSKGLRAPASLITPGSTSCCKGARPEARLSEECFGVSPAARRQLAHKRCHRLAIAAQAQPGQPHLRSRHPTRRPTRRPPAAAVPPHTRRHARLCQARAGGAAHLRPLCGRPAPAVHRDARVPGQQRKGLLGCLGVSAGAPAAGTHPLHAIAQRPPSVKQACHLRVTLSKVYPLPFIDRISEEKADQEWDAVRGCAC